MTNELLQLDKPALEHLCHVRSLKISGTKQELLRRLRPSFRTQPDDLLLSLRVSELKRICRGTAWEEDDEPYQINDAGRKLELIERIWDFYLEESG